MKKINKIYLYNWLFLVCAWVLYMNLEYLIILSFKPHIDYGELSDYAHSTLAYFEHTVFGFIFGSFFAIIHHLSELPIIRRLSFSRVIMIKSILYVIGLGLAFLLLVGLWILLGSLEGETLNEAMAFITPKAIINRLVYMVFFILLTNFILEINKKFGYGNLWKTITGKYHKPRIENRVFMFLDLKGSTTIAETLGHELYSKLVQNCFYDLTDIVIKYNAQIYQYVGDEVILTWPINDGLKNLNCINFFFAYQEKLLSRKEYYKKKFGLLPEFKAGLEMGNVTVAEIGEIKREIAYHGDVLNTAARIEGKCNEYGKSVLVSENISIAVENISKIKLNIIGDLQLKGKEEFVKIYAVDHKLNFSL